MTALNLVDSAAAVDAGAAVAGGIAGVIRYVSQEPAKNLTAGEAAAYHGAGLTVNAVYEDGTTDYEGGATAGEQHGAVAKALLDAIGYPADRGLIVAVDTDIPSAAYPLGLAYVRATATASGRVAGVYGPDAFVRYCMASGVKYGMNAAGWRDGAPNAAQIQQGAPAVSIGGTECDPDTATAADYGQWPYTPPDPPPPPPAPWIAAAQVTGHPGHAWFLRPTGEVDGRDVAGGAVTSYGGVAARTLHRPPIAIGSTPSGKGYWLAAEDGGVFAFGDAAFRGSAAGKHLNKPVVGMIVDPDAKGYAVVAADGGVFAFGAVRFVGSAAGEKLNEPIVGACATASGAGYWMLAEDGGVFAYGDARFHGSAVARGAPAAVGIAACGAGYVVARTDGSVAAFGTALAGDYPSLAPDQRLGVRCFVGIAGGVAGDYTLFGNDGTQYHFAPGG
jgi:hypothetical protein